MDSRKGKLRPHTWGDRRVQIVDLLRQGVKNQTEIAKLTGCSRQLVHIHLRSLETVETVPRPERFGRWTTSDN